MNISDAIKTLVPMPEWIAAWEARANTGASAVDAYLASAWAARAMEIKATAIASVPLCLWNDEDDEIEEHPILDLLQTVNAEWNPSDLWKYTENALHVYPAAYWQKVRAGRKVRELFFLNPSTMSVEIGTSGISGFTQTLSGKKTDFARDDVVYFRGAYDPLNDLTGLPLLNFAKIAAMSEQNADVFLSAFFANGAVPPLVFTSESQVSDTEINRFIQWWNRLFRGAQNRHKTGIIGGGLKPVQLGNKIKDLSMTEVRSEIHRSISTITGVPELLISPTGADLTPVRMAEGILYRQTIIPRLDWYAEVLNSELLTEYPDLVKSGAYLAFDTSEIEALQEDETLKATRAKIYFDMGVPVLTALDMADIYVDEETEAELSAEPEQPEPMIETPESQAQEDVQEEDTAPTEAMNKYMLKAIKNIGKPFDFVHVEIPPATADYIKAQLADCKTAEEVRNVFAMLPSSDVLILARSIDRLANVS